jgi:hypothetical protein
MLAFSETPGTRTSTVMKAWEWRGALAAGTWVFGRVAYSAVVLLSNRAAAGCP